MDHKRRERYSKEFRRQAVERMNACDNISRLSRELTGVTGWSTDILQLDVPASLYCASRFLLLNGCWQTRRSNWIFSDVPCKG